MKKELELFTCPNPECHEKIEELIVVRDISTTPAEKYYACPHCLIKLDVIFGEYLKQQEKERREEPSVKPSEEEPPVKPPEKEKGFSKCAGYLGYLASLPEDKPVPRECLVCPKVLNCVLKASDS